ncbi:MULTISPECIES: beta-ketoacyl-[acyl-carrier-protein] synthase family protein [Streptomyces]|uniref:3-oxoacyl-[acyl-carrier-protein] synthase, KASII n=1 Tax=Streptomyces venezuelae (strain ATCC 10712 / CBS 650.69 / DSM 40230 / JCM 4526 / NBRC 13096 / PD 04745) TaxID=953739 RepID=F2RDJ0_STRVP|nr:beta-ketoacyl-[acyl-carrier-protein] synthase family protein [Streptomyces venezuelae]APE24949.1 3-oxoacyl-ACP synthase [Streptomyces venezuelae]QES02295.1 beta-ketoacyl-[acyl-carrier-protein] synthase family protein [Streptomyces venezuelae ATCC 10712]CCA59482.1 3-oxoacyl-[acyl-carrier-protein] synthase, KASII [Streptomyces venezuelae ATCC 10712]
MTTAVITGVGAVTPLGVGAGVLHRRAVAGESGVSGGTGHCAGFHPGDHLSRKELRRTDRFTQLALVAAQEALTQAGWKAGALPYDPGRIATVIGCGLGGTASFEAQQEVLAAQGAEYVSPFMVPAMMANAAAAHLSMVHGLTGESLCVTSACSSGAQAVGTGMRLLASGAADAVVVGGAESAASPLIAAAFRNAGALSPTGTSVPFDRDRDGFLLGEGAGVLVLETAEGAARRGAEVLGSVLGYGASSDAHHLTAPEPSGRSAATAVVRAMTAAGAEPGDLAYINAHGTGTLLNDQLESEALRSALGAALPAIPISSSKAAIGHLLGAAGAVEAVATLQALRHATAPPTAGLREPDERLGPLDLVRTARPLPMDRPDRALLGLSTSFGFGGHNAALVLASPGVRKGQD